MEKIYDIVIIGAGVTGAMLAHKLAKYQLDVAVVEAGCDVASGASRANSAIVHAGFDAAEGTLKAKLNVKGCAAMPELAHQLDVPYKNNTSLVVGFGDRIKENDVVRFLFRFGDRRREVLFVDAVEPNVEKERNAVAGNAGDRVDDRNAFADQPVKNTRFADVRSADDCNFCNAHY
jgi:glycerol-3-phosphate dehydrogenase